MRNPAWTRDEHLLALDLYLRLNFAQNASHISQTHPEVIGLSGVLRGLGLHGPNPQDGSFRNPNAVYMKLCNFLRLDPAYSGTGLSQGSRIEEEVWSEFSGSPAQLAALTHAIRARGGTSDDGMAGEDEEFPEGRIIERLHRQRERNSAAVRKLKHQAQERGELRCEACGFDFAAQYGEPGVGFIECHHLAPLASYGPEQRTRLADLALVCANCHRMLHRRRPWLGRAELGALTRPVL